MVPKIACHSCSEIATTANEIVDNRYENIMKMVDTCAPLEKNEMIDASIWNVQLIEIYHTWH